MAAARKHHSVLYIMLSLLVAPLLVGLLVNFSTTKPWWWSGGNSEAPSTKDSSVLDFAGSCGVFELYAQNRWPPYGASKRAAPNLSAKKVGDFGPNEIVAVDGWVHSERVYPENPPPFYTDIWFHLSDNSGWVSFAAVRAVSTSPAATNLDQDGGPPAPAPPQCKGAVR